MQKCNSVKGVLIKPTDIPELVNLAPTLHHSVKEHLQRTAAPWPTVTPWDSNDPIVDIESHEMLLCWFLAVDVIRVVRSVGPASRLLHAGKSLKDQTSAHRDDIGSAPAAIMVDAIHWEVVLLWQQFKR